MRNNYEVGLGDSPMRIAGALSGDPGRYEELLRANPHKPLAQRGGRVTFAVLVAGELLSVPPGWDRPHPRLRGQFTPLPDGYLAGYLGGPSGDTLGTNQGMKIGDSLTSPDGNVSMTLQQDGDLVIKAKDGTVLWRSGTAGKGVYWLWMNWDGILRLEKPPGGVANQVWNNGVGPGQHKDAHLRLENSGNAFVWDGSNHQIWDAGASIARPNPVPGGHGAAHTDFGGIDHDLNNLSHDLQHFGNDVIDDVKQFGPVILSQIQGLVAMVPGIGTGISAAIGLAMALIEGGSPIIIAIRMAYGALPIPPGMRGVTDAIVDGIIHFVENPHDFTDVAIRTIRDQVPADLPRQVFDTLVKIVIQHQPIIKATADLAAQAAQSPAVQSVVSSMPPAGTVLPSIQQIAPNGVHIDVASIPAMLQAAQAQTKPQHQANPAALPAIAQQAQKRYVPLHALAVMTSTAQLAHKIGGNQAAVAVLEHPLHAPQQIIAQHPPSPPPRPARPPYPPYVRGSAGGHTAAYLPYVRGNVHAAPAPRPGVHGLGECAPPCSQLGEPVEMDHRMSQVARMLVTARNGQPTVAKGPDGVDYRFEDVDGGIVARRCLG